MRAVEAPRLHVERDGTVSFEPGLPEQARSRAPRARREGACLARSAICSSAACTPRAVIAKGGVEGAGDPRRRGVAFIV